MDGIFVALFIAAVAWIFLKRNSKTTSKQNRKTQIGKTQAIDMSVALHWPAENGYEFNIAGESDYQDALQQLAGDHGDDWSHAEHTALLIPDGINNYDQPVIRVEINGMTVGYLGSNNSKSFRRRLGGKKLTGRVTSCNALVAGGKLKDDGTRMHYGVKLDLKPFW